MIYDLLGDSLTSAFAGGAGGYSADSLAGSIHCMFVKMTETVSMV